MTLITSGTLKGDDMADEAVDVPKEIPASFGETFAIRKAARTKAVQPEGAENKAVAKKSTTKK